MKAGQGQAGALLAEPGHERGELLETAPGPSGHVGRRGRGPGQESMALAGRDLLQSNQRGPSDTATRRLHGAQEGRIVGGVHDEAEVGQGVLDLLALVEADAAHDDVGDARAPQGVLQHARLGVGPVEDRHLAPPQPRAPHGQDALGHEVGLLVLVPGAIEGGALALLVLRPQGLVLARGVVGDHRPGRRQDALGGAIVLLEPDHAGARIVPLEVEDVADVRPAPLVDRLVGIADAADVAVLAGEEADDPVLRAVGVLVLVDQDVAPEPAVPGQHLGHLVEEAHGEEQQVVEVHAAGGLQARLVAPVHRGQPLLAGTARGLLDVGRGQHLVLGRADAVHDRAGGDALVLEPLRAHALLDQGLAVVLVVDREVRRIAEMAHVLAQHAHADGVEGGHQRRLEPGGREERLHAPGHLAGRLVGEGDGEDVSGVHAAHADQIGHAVGDDARLAASGRGEDEERAVAGDDGLALRRIEVADKRLGVQHEPRLYRARRPGALRIRVPARLARLAESRITRA